MWQVILHLWTRLAGSVFSSEALAFALSPLVAGKRIASVDYQTI
jgi:hypothetical protein